MDTAALKAPSTGARSLRRIVSPAMGGVVVGYEMGRQLGVPAIFFERVEGKFALRRGFEIEPGQRCLHTSHAEENALGFCDGAVLTAYVTDEPCLTCTRAMVRRGVRRVVFLRPYASIGDQERLEREAILKHFQIQWVHLPLG